MMIDQTDETRQKIQRLSQRAFQLAVARWQRRAPLDEDELIEAQRLQVELRALAAEVREHQPKLHAALSDAISEGLLDLKYAISTPRATSLRLHHYIESQPGTR
jgi:hypothetical protein